MINPKSKNFISLRWGNSVAVRDALESGIPVVMLNQALNHQLAIREANYVPFLGTDELIEATKKVVKRQTGKTFKYLALTNGAAGGVVVSLRLFADLGAKYAITKEAPYFSLYPDMVRAAGLIHLPWDGKGIYPYGNPDVYLIDQPSNPEGDIIPIHNTFGRPVIHDAVYFNRVYGYNENAITSDVMVGSYSKLLGINGVRVGWVATNNDAYFDGLKHIISGSYCGLSSWDVKIVTDILKWLNWTKFEKTAVNMLNANRTEWQKLEKYFWGVPVPSVGMFQFCPVDKHAKKLLKKAEVEYAPGSQLGHMDDFGRFNLGHSVAVINQAVKQILKADKLK